jgi:hypothetical protein
MQWPDWSVQPHAARRSRWPAALCLVGALVLVGLPTAAPAQVTLPPPVLATAAASTAAPELTLFELSRTEDGLQLAFAVNFALPRGVEDALQKGIPLYFVAQADVYRSRWYWRDRRVASAERTWRLAFQPLTRKYRVSFGGLNQSFDSLADAMVTVRRVATWKIADAAALEPDTSHYVEFRYRLDTSLLPRPLQIGLGGQADWNLQVEQSMRVD